MPEELDHISCTAAQPGWQRHRSIAQPCRVEARLSHSADPELAAILSGKAVIPPLLLLYSLIPVCFLAFYQSSLDFTAATSYQVPKWHPSSDRQTVDRCLPVDLR
jgi:hypothetical protein